VIPRGPMRLVCFLLMVLAPFAASAQSLTVFAAASLTDAMNDISVLWVKAGHAAPRLSFASSSTLARQIQQGAPVNVFASADEKWMDYLAKANLIVPGTRHDILGNDLVLVVPANHPIHVDLGPGLDLAALLGPNGRLAVGDPTHVPAGIYAEQALRKLGLWDKVAPRLAAAADVAVSKAVTIAGVFPPASHDAITYPFALIKTGDTPQARAFLAFMSTPAAREIWVKRGFKVE
jgi:molybdate transport system substrate-binding protein